MRILVVDDDFIALSLIEAALAQYGFNNVTTALSAVDAMDAIKLAPTPFDCFLLDYRMPDIDGADLCSQIRKIREYKSTPVIFVTAASDRASVNTAYSVGAVDYVSKPIDPMEIGIRVSLAEKLVLEERERKKSRSAAPTGPRPMERFPAFAVEDAVPVFNVTGVISRLALENYLVGLTQNKPGDCAVSALAINEFQEIYDRATPALVYAVLTEIAKIVSKSLRRNETLISYNGYGEFICVSKKTDLSANEGHTRLINSRIARLNLAFEDGAPCNATVSIGKPAQSPQWSKAEPGRLIETALVSAGTAQHVFRSTAATGASATACSSPILNL